MKLNCWEFKKCGRELGGTKTNELGACPASTEKRLNGIHEGSNSGRACWVVAGTLCQGVVQGIFALKFGKCQECDFYKLVKNEEGSKFEYIGALANKLKHNN